MEVSVGIGVGGGFWLGLSGGWEGHFVVYRGKREGSKAAGLARWA